MRNPADDFFGEAIHIFDGWALDSPANIAEAFEGLLTLGLWNLPGLRNFHGTIDDAFGQINLALAGQLNIKLSLVEQATQRFVRPIKAELSPTWGLIEGRENAHRWFFRLREEPSLLDAADIEACAQHARQRLQKLIEPSDRDWPPSSVLAATLRPILDHPHVQDCILGDARKLDLCGFAEIGGILNFCWPRDPYILEYQHRRRLCLDDVFWAMCEPLNQQWGSAEGWAQLQHHTQHYQPPVWLTWASQTYKPSPFVEKCAICQRAYDVFMEEETIRIAERAKSPRKARDLRDSSGEATAMVEQVEFLGGPPISPLAASYGVTLFPVSLAGNYGATLFTSGASEPLPNALELAHAPPKPTKG